MNRIAELRAVARVRRGDEFTQEALAGRLGITRQTLASWEQGLTEPTVSQAVALAHEFGVPVEDLGFGAGAEGEAGK